MHRTPPDTVNKGTPRETATSSHSQNIEIPQEITMEYPSGKLAVITRKRNEIIIQLDAAPRADEEHVKQLFAAHEERVQNFQEACELQLNNENIPEAERSRFIQWYQTHCSEIELFKKDVNKWLQDEPEQILPRHSVSNVGSRRSGSRNSRASKSSCSSLRQKLAEERARRLADESILVDQEQLVKRKFEAEQRRMAEEQEEKQRRMAQEIEQHQRQEQEERQIRTEQQTIERQRRLRYEENLQDEIDALDGASQSGVSRHSETLHQKKVFNQVQTLPLIKSTKFEPVQPLPTRINCASTSAPTNSLVEVLAKQNELSMMILQSQERASLPKNEPECFDGTDLTKYESFIQSFKGMIEERCDKDLDKLYYLEKYTTGLPLQLVRSCRGGNPSEGYQAAIKLLQKEFGNQYCIANAYLKRIEDWPLIKNEDGVSMRQLSIFLMSCINRMRNMTSLNQLNSPQEIMKVISKLPYKYRDKWRHYTFKLMNCDKVVCFQDLSNFIHDQASMLNQPLYGDINDLKEVKGSAKIPHTYKKKSFATSTLKPKELNHNRDFKINNSKDCEYCKKSNHPIRKCFFFVKIKHGDKLKFVRENQLCYGCLEKGHLSKTCTKRLSCDICNKTHPTCLHLDKAEIEKQPEKTVEINPDNVTNCATRSASVSKHNGAGRRTVCAAVPVKIRAQGSNKFVTTYMGMDSYSTDCFMDHKLLKTLGVKGVETHISLTTMDKRQTPVKTMVLNNLEIFDLNENERSLIPVIYCKTDWPFAKEDSPRPEDTNGLPYLNDVPFEYTEGEIGLLVGLNQPEIVRPIKIITGPQDGPYATQHKFGWAFNGTITNSSEGSSHCHHIKIEDRGHVDEMFRNLCAMDFRDEQAESMGPSIEDQKWQKKVQNSLKKQTDGHYEVELPFRDDSLGLPFNRSQAYGRLLTSKRRLRSNNDFYIDYKSFMDSMFEMNFAEPVPSSDLKKETGKVWYLTHHGIYHKQKKKIRVVFDCSLKYQGISLNDTLLQGPDLTCNLLGVLLRFRQEKVAFMGDIQKMFYQVRVPKHQRDFLRFLWYPNGNLDAEPLDYRVTVHIFGAISSPSCANFVLRQTALTSESKFYSEEARKTISRNFYVDDLIKSVAVEEKAIHLLNEIKHLLSSGGFKLLGFVSNSRELLRSLPSDELAKNYKELDLLCDDLPYERALGVTWDVDRDAIGFKVNLDKLPYTKRGILSTVFSVYDPFGIACPAILPAKKIFQQACHEKLQWDDPLPESLLKKWNIWLKGIPLLSGYKIPRCYKVNEDIEEVQLHIFCDGSETAYGAVAYLRFSTKKHKVHCSLVLAKSRLVPIGGTTLATIPRIELNAARLAITVQQILHRELDIKNLKEFFWTDSTTVLKYINCETKRFQRFVSNRVAFIRDHSSPQSWYHVPGELNPADLASRGLKVMDFLKNESWMHGPTFLWKDKEFWPHLCNSDQISDDDLEIKKDKLVISTRVECREATDRLLMSFSNWHKTKTRIAWILRVKQGLHLGKWEESKLGLEELKKAEIAIWQYIQEKEFKEILNRLKTGAKLLLKNKLTKLHPFVDGDGLLRVGGRLNKAEEPYEAKHPVILPADYHVTRLLCEHIHIKAGHLGKETVLSSLRQSYWVIGGNSLIRKIVRECFACRKRQKQSSEQLMGELPAERIVGDQPAFTNIGIDCFGPFSVIRGRGREKRYGVIFTCLASRAVHLEIAFSLDTSSFINALRRFVSRRGFPKIIRSDNGTNFVGADRELKDAIKDWNCKQTEEWMLQNAIEWKFQPPAASHFGGVWEREIRTIRKVISGLTNEQPLHLNDEGLSTLMCEVESILNSRPLTEVSSDPNDMTAITPNHLILMHSGITFPPGLFNKDDLYTKRRWRQIQHLANLFWTRWKREYLPLLQERQKWNLKKRSHQVGDLVLLVDQLLPRNQWSLGRIMGVTKDSHGDVRVVDVKVSRLKESNSPTTIRRAINKIVLLRSADEL